jgi:hypothetical protein
VDVAVVVDGDDPDDGLAVPVASQEHRARTNSVRVVGPGERRPAESVLVLGVEVGAQLNHPRMRR